MTRIDADPVTAGVQDFDAGAGTRFVVATSKFKIDGAGDLTAVDQDPAVPGQQDYTSPNSDFMAIVHPTLHVLYVSGGSSSGILALAYDANGVLSPVGTEPMAGVDGGPGPSAYGLAVDPSGEHLYAVGYFDGVVNVYAIDQVTGAITTASTATTSSEMRAVSVDSTGKYLFCSGDDTPLLTYGITAGTGALTKLGAGVSTPQGAYTNPVTIVP